MANRLGLPVFGGPDNYLKRGDWQASASFRGAVSDKHYQGTDPFPALDPFGPTNRQMQLRLGLAYAISSRTSLWTAIPLHANSFTVNRVPPGGDHQVRDASRASGLGDVMLGVRRWMRDPANCGRANIALSAGFKLPTGRADVTDRVYGRELPVDWSIQLGDRGWGFAPGFDGYWAAGRVTIFAAGTYLFNPRDTTGTPSFFGALANSRSNVANSATDQFSAQVGLSWRPRPGWPVPSLDYRVEGVPVDDVFGRSNGARRPGTIHFVEPGLTLMFSHRHQVTFSVPLTVHINIKDSPRSVRVEDATVPDAVVIFGYAVRF